MQRPSKIFLGVALGITGMLVLVPSRRLNQKSVLLPSIPEVVNTAQINLITFDEKTKWHLQDVLNHISLCADNKDEASVASLRYSVDDCQMHLWNPKHQGLTNITVAKDLFVHFCDRALLTIRENCNTNDQYIVNMTGHIGRRAASIRDNISFRQIPLQTNAFIIPTNITLKASP